MGVAENGRGRPRKMFKTYNNVFKLSEVHDPVGRWLLTKKSSEYEIGQIPKKGTISQKKDNFTKKHTRFHEI